MRKFDFWKSDWFLGVAVVIAVALFARFSDLVPSLERKAYDLGVAATSRAPSDKIAVIAIDEASIRSIGRLPWPRDVHAKMTDLLSQAKAKVIGSTILLSEPQVDPGYQYILQLQELAGKVSEVGAPAAEAVSPIIDKLKEAELALNADRRLSESYAKAANVVVPLGFVIGRPIGNPDKPLPEYVQRNAVSVAGDSAAGKPLPAQSVQIPIESIGKAAAGMGNLTQYKDVDGTVRSEPLLLEYFGKYYPSFSMMLVAKYLNLGSADIKATLGQGVSMQNLRISTDPELRMYTYFYKNRGEKPAFAVDSFSDVLSGKVRADNYRDKIVLIGATASGLVDNPATPVASEIAPVLLIAQVVSSILQEHFFVTPTWLYGAELLVFALVAVYLVALLPRLKAGTALVISGGAFIVFLAVHFSLMMSAGMWMQLMLPATLLLVGHGALVSKRFIVTERAKVKSDENSAESNRMLGLAYQGQGLLDQAWDKFRQVPLAETVMDNLYNLALDFERKRQFNKAESVFCHMAGFDPKFRDLEQRLSRARQLSETVMLGGSASAGRTNTSILGAGSVEKPMLGRYQVEKELGKGAMGVVYLGKDPKIGRVVAIKTMALAQEFEADEIAEVKERFFREAETAGRLSHPNIVTIYDAGEEHDLCYIAMELLKGGDLVPFCKPDKLLPAEKVVSIIARAAEALGYAHKQNVVHRDVKPANMMYDLETDTLKMADFGIARLTDSSKTKTGMVLGTPSYMSPEQLAGKKIEGRSDLFSLSVSLYQLLSGKLPFQGESMAQLMFKIANETPADIRSVNPSVPPGLAAFLERALAKNPDQRFQSGGEFAAALRAALAGAPVAAASSTTVDIEL